MQYTKPSQEEMNQARYAGDSRPNYVEEQKSTERWTDMANEGAAAPYYMYHKDRYNEHR